MVSFRTNCPNLYSANPDPNPNPQTLTLEPERSRSDCRDLAGLRMVGKQHHRKQGSGTGVRSHSREPLRLCRGPCTREAYLYLTRTLTLIAHVKPTSTLDGG